MSLTTDITGGLFGPTEEEERYLRQLALQQDKLENLAALQEARQQAALPNKRLGLPGYYDNRPTASPEATRLTLAALRGRELGEPVSYGGQGPLTPEQVGAAQQQGLALGATGEPIEVIRRTTATYAGPRAGGEEYLTAGQARQAFRRDLGTGEYIPLGSLKADPFKRAEAAVLEANLAKKELENKLLGEFGIPDKEDPNKLVLPPYAQRLLLQASPRTLAEVDTVYKNLVPQVKEYKALEDLGSPQNRALMYKNYLRAAELGLVPKMPEAAKIFQQGAITPETRKAFEQWLNWREPGIEAPTRPPSPAAPPPRPQETPVPPSLEGLYQKWRGMTGALAPNEGQYTRELGLGALAEAMFGAPKDWPEMRRRLAELERAEYGPEAYPAPQPKEAAASPLITPPEEWYERD